jgi:hypothetical protein
MVGRLGGCRCRCDWRCRPAVFEDEDLDHARHGQLRRLRADLYIVAQALERFLEPFASRFGTTVAPKDELGPAREATAQARSEYDAAVKAKTETGALETALDLARRHERWMLADLRKIRSERALHLWAVATAMASLVTAALGLGLIAAIAKTGGFPDKHWLHALDVVLTGLAIGAGTKPLHDLIARLEKAKEIADPATKPATPATPAATQ